MNHETFLAYRKYPEPNGKKYFKSDLLDKQQVIELFDYCQILEAIITKQGWKFLIEKYGFEELYVFNKESCWGDYESFLDFKEDIQLKLM